MYLIVVFAFLYWLMTWSFHLLIGYLSMHFKEMSIEIFYPYFSWFVFFSLSCSSFYILDIKHLLSSTLYVVFSLSW